MGSSSGLELAQEHLFLWILTCLARDLEVAACAVLECASFLRRMNFHDASKNQRLKKGGLGIVPTGGVQV